MASTVFNGTDLVLKVINDGGTLEPLGHSTSCSMTINHDLPESTTKDSAGYQEVISGQRSFEISFDGLVDYTDGSNNKQNHTHLSTQIDNRQNIDFTFGTAVSGDTLISGEGFISSLEISGEMESPTSYSGTIVGTGSLTFATNS